MITVLQIIVPAAVSALSVFATYWFGSRTATQEKEYSINERVYIEFHVPFIRKLSSYNPDSRDFFSMIVIPGVNHIERDFILEHFITNIQFAPKKTIPLISQYFKLTGDFAFYEPSSERFESVEMEKRMIDASNLFDKILKETLSESSRLATNLKYPDISQPILEEFLKQENLTEANQRHLPLHNRILKQ